MCDVRAGHPYSLENGVKVLALEEGIPIVKVLIVDEINKMRWDTLSVLATTLTARPLRYLDGQLPK